MARVGIEQAQFVAGDEHVAGLIEAAAAGPAEHLQDFIGLERLFGLVTAIGVAGKGDAAQREVNAGGQAHGRHHHAQLPGLGQRLDDPRPRPVAQAAVMVSDAALEQLGQVFPDNESSAPVLSGSGLGMGRLPRQFGGHRFGRRRARGENQDRAEVFGQRLGHQPRPVARISAADGS